MRDLPPGPVRVQLFLGPGVPIPVNADILNALTAVKVESSAGEAQSGFELTFTIPRDSPIQALAPIDVPLLRCVIAVSLRGTTTVLMDGVVTHHDVATNGPQLTLHVKGKDLSAAMDVIAFDGVPYPAMSPSMIALTCLAKYAALGCVPLVIPGPAEDIPLPTERIPTQQGTDYKFLKGLAETVGHVFYLDPGPTVGVSRAYWGPEVRTGVPQPALTVGQGAHIDNVTSLSFSFDKERKQLPVVMIHEKTSHASIPVPIPDVTPLNPPLGLVSPIPPKQHRLAETANLSPIAALAKGIGYAAAHQDCAFGSGALEVARYGHVLQARALVGVRGAGLAYDGLYFVTKVTHDIRRGGYTQQFSLARNGLISTVPAVPA
ncbi:hypothetical protein MINS_31610 [Mycolicibacterium insubricum]|uniref:Uncharacterized protein n=1 Tax=Mycolicibacterium insubricum TaxID=444597 RepID=A0A1X0D4R0_9MYCO|nr:hypothetical protein [Mycolicibacterium sp.]MCV7083828.1 hypothetical protein [Mycolicibacterium insubricum]ORA67394.1 hypothetical protein BST26_15785 [Mycolicibacterium insubricum]BBZ67732.1 hypothetical protein MINS_31610 [Mycolicibacterium insubricum]